MCRPVSYSVLTHRATAVIITMPLIYGCTPGNAIRHAAMCKYHIVRLPQQMNVKSISINIEQEAGYQFGNKAVDHVVLCISHKPGLRNTTIYKTLTTQNLEMYSWKKDQWSSVHCLANGVTPYLQHSWQLAI